MRDFKEDLSALYPLEQIVLHDLTLPQIRELIVKRLAPLNLGEELWQKMGGNDELLAFWEFVVAKGREADFWKSGAYKWNEFYEEDGKNDWRSGLNAWNAMHSDARRLIPLARTPFMTVQLCEIYAESGALPANRVDLFRQLVQQSFAREEKRMETQGKRWLGNEPLSAALVELARAMQARATTVLPRAESLNLLHASDAPDLKTLLAGATSDMVLDTLLATGLLLQTPSSELAFSHQLIQEYFAVRILLEKYPEKSPASFVDAEWWDAKAWRETFVILGEHLGLELGTVEGANAAARWLAPVTPEIALDCVRRHGAGLILDDVTPDTRAALIAAARAKTTEPHPHGRAAAYRVLALFNADTRPGVGVRPDGLPDILWCPVPAGEFSWQDGKATLDYDYYIAQYPLTYAQYQLFINAKGYEQDEWWEGLERRAPESQYFHYANHPRETITWWESVAYARWLNAQLKARANDILAQHTIRESERGVWEGIAGGALVVTLPTEEEWEKAARGNDGREFPWGPDYISGYANIDETDGNTGFYYLRQPSAVGIYPPESASPCGAMDMAGNVWEWTLSAYEEEEKRVEEQSGRWTLHNNQAARVLRGGSWPYNHPYARAAFRDWDLPNFGFYFRGVRLCLAPAPTRSER